MENSSAVSLNEEFYIIVGVVLKNWYALEIGINESTDEQVVLRSKLERLLYTAIQGVINIMDNKIDIDDAADEIADILDDDFNIVLEDRSEYVVMNELLELYKWLAANDRQNIILKMKSLNRHVHIVTGESYRLNENLSTSSGIFEKCLRIKTQEAMECSSEAGECSSALKASQERQFNNNDSFGEEGDGWEVVGNRKKKTNN